MCGLYVMRRYNPSGRLPGRLPVHGPEGTAERVSRMYHGLQPGDMDEELMSGSSRMPRRSGSGWFTITPRSVHHPVEVFGYRVKGGGWLATRWVDINDCLERTFLRAADFAPADRAFVTAGGLPRHPSLGLAGRPRGRACGRGGAARPHPHAAVERPGGMPCPGGGRVVGPARGRPGRFSRSYAELREAGLLAGSVTVGQAFGGDLEAVTVHSGLLAARLALAADLVVLTQGPGNLGTGTRWGFSGVAAGEAVNAAAVLGGRPVGSLRVSAADPRERHRGVSHHSLTAYGRVALMRCAIAVPDFGAEPGLEGLVEPVAQAAALLGRRHDLVPVDLTGLLSLLVSSPIRLSSMGRGVRDDPAYFLAAAAAGRHAAHLLTPSEGATAAPG